MGTEVNWSEVFRIMYTGISAVFIIMLILAGATTLMGRIVQHFEKSKEDKPTS